MRQTKPADIEYITIEVIVNNMGYPEFRSTIEMDEYFAENKIIPSEKMILVMEKRIELKERTNRLINQGPIPTVKE